VKAVVAQKGAREHFLAARALHDRGALAKLVVDWYSPLGPRFDRVVSFLLGAKGRSAVAARTDAIPGDLICALRCFGLWSRWQEQKAARRGRLYNGFDRGDAAFAKRVAKLALPPHDAFFGYSYASLETIEAENRRGRLTIVDQIDPGAVEYRLVAEEMARHPELAGPPAPFPSGHYGRARREWDLADVIIVNSEWSREAVVAEGGDGAKIEILPLGFESEKRPRRTELRRAKGDPLKVLWLGQVNVRKGIHYLLEAARLLEKEAVEFQVAGPIAIRRSAVAEAPKNVRWLGPVPRSEASDLYDRCDVFVLPTLSDGFAITQLEALARGLPIIVTPNCGRVVEDGKTGFLVPPRDAKALAQAIMKFVEKPLLAAEMSFCCLQVAQAFSIDAYGKRLVEIVERNMAARQRAA
jgi:glycosyltransferase involved in cell wall biosynthesis